MRLSSFIDQNKDSILEAWENFAQSIEPPASTMNSEDLRDHASLMLNTIVSDLKESQTSAEQVAKSKGLALKAHRETAAEEHARQRLESGYTVTQLVSEYRALRASVIKLWTQDGGTAASTYSQDLIRFNEAVDQAVAESVARFEEIAQNDVRNERLLLDAVLNAAPVGIMLVDTNGKLVLSNPENTRIWGNHPTPYGIDDYSDWKAWVADGSDNQGRRLEGDDWPVVKVLKGEASAQGILEIEPFDSPTTKRTIAVQATSATDQENNLAGAVVAQMDITGRVMTEAALRESEAKFRTISNAMPQMVWSALPDGYHDYFNQRWYDFTGVPEGATDGAGWKEVFHADDRAHAWKKWHHSLETGEPYEVHYRLRHHSSEYRWTLGRALPIRNEAGDIIRWMGTCTDIHDQKLAEEELKKANQRKDEFLAMLAHELRNPLAPISTAAQLIMNSGDNSPDIQKYGVILDRQVQHLTELVNDLLDVSRVTRGLIKLEKKVVDMKDVVTNAIEQTRPLIEERQHDLTFHMASSAADVFGDKTRLIQVFVNLLNNAAKYTDPGGEIAVDLETQKSQIVITIKDNGSGISASLLPHVFDLFTQAERSPDRVQGGLGLGLALVKSLVTLHGGYVAVRSVESESGTTFKVVLPLIKKEEVENLQPEEELDQQPSTSPVRIMIVDDNIDAAQTLCLLLQSAGHTVAVKTSAESVLNTVERQAVRVFILDIGMPGMNGNELARLLKASPETADATLIALTGYGQAHDIAKSKEAGFDYHLVKPVDLKQLNNILLQCSQ